jgi:hypothetical protein
MTFEASQDADEGDVSANTDGFEHRRQQQDYVNALNLQASRPVIDKVFDFAALPDAFRTHHQPLQPGLFTHQQMGGHMTFEASQDADEGDVSPAWGATVQDITGHRGADIILELGGPGTLSQSFEPPAPAAGPVYSSADGWAHDLRSQSGRR